MKNQFLALVLGLLTLSAAEVQASVELKEVHDPAAVAELPGGSSLPYVMTINLHDAVLVDIEAGVAPKAPVCIGSVLSGFTSELLKHPSSKLIRPAYRSWLRR